VSFFSTIEGDFDPGGDPGAIRTAAIAYRTLASELLQVVSALDKEAAGLEESWKGLPGGAGESASAAFQKAWKAFSAAITEYAQGLDGAAGHLDTIADAIQNADEEAARLRDMAVAALAVGAALTLFSFGTSDLTAVGDALADAAAATTIMDTLGGLLAAAVEALGSLLDAFVGVASRFAMGSTFTLISEMIDKAIHGLDPLDPANYSADDIANVIRGGMVQAVLGVGSDWAEDSSPAFKAFETANPVLYTTAYAGLNGFISTALTEYAIEGKKVDLSTVGDVALGTALAAGSGAAVRGGVSWLGSRGGSVGQIFSPGPGSGSLSQILNKVGNVTNISKANVIDAWANQPGSVLRYNLFFPQPQALTGPHAPSAPPGVPVPQVPPPPHIGGGTVTVQPGDDLYQIAGQRLGNPNLYPVIQAVNPQVSADGSIAPGQVLHIPQLPPLPSGSTAQVVQQGDTVSGLAGGNPALEHQIIELNGLDSQAQIQPGDVLILPPAG
jgi:WXG100 family type VII secretion target